MGYGMFIYYVVWCDILINVDVKRGCLWFFGYLFVRSFFCNLWFGFIEVGVREFCWR